jgi:hypothetical protein
MGENLGFNASLGCVLQTLEPTTEAMRRKNRINQEDVNRLTKVAVEKIKQSF